MTKAISFNTKGYDGFIDFIKAYAIVCVLIAHTIPLLNNVGFAIWGDIQVPLFILVQAFHCYKKDSIVFSFKKVMSRVMIPFFIIEMLTFLIAKECTDTEFKSLLKKFLISGGYGPGSYYPWVYLQVAMLLPLFVPIMKWFSKSKITLFLSFVVICESFEIFFSIIDFPEEMYRLLAVRYFFLFFLGWLWVKEGIFINRYTSVLSIISLIATIYFEYFSVDSEPLFYATNWKTHRWPCYFFVSYGIVFFLYIIWQKIVVLRLEKWVKLIAVSSYEIFLIQMSVIYLLKSEHLYFIENKVLRAFFWFFIVWTVSLIGGITLNKMVKSAKRNVING